MWLFDVLVLLLLALLCGLLWMGWQFKIYIAKLRAQEARFAELEGRIQAVQSDATAISTKKTVRSGVQTEWNQMCFYMRPHSRVLHKEDCQYLQRTWSERTPSMSDMLSALMTVPWVSFLKKACPALSCH